MQNCLHCDGEEEGVANAAPGSAAKMSHAADNGLFEASAADPNRKWNEVESRKATAEATAETHRWSAASK